MHTNMMLALVALTIVMLVTPAAATTPATISPSTIAPATLAPGLTYDPMVHPCHLFAGRRWCLAWSPCEWRTKERLCRNIGIPDSTASPPTPAPTYTPNPIRIPCSFKKERRWCKVTHSTNVTFCEWDTDANECRDPVATRTPATISPSTISPATPSPPWRHPCDLKTSGGSCLTSIYNCAWNPDKNVCTHVLPCHFYNKHSTACNRAFGCTWNTGNNECESAVEAASEAVATFVIVLIVVGVVVVLGVVACIVCCCCCGASACMKKEDTTVVVQQTPQEGVDKHTLQEVVVQQPPQEQEVVVKETPQANANPY